VCRCGIPLGSVKVLVEVIDPRTGKHVKDGEEGEVIVTSLYHTETPLIRCRMRDRAVSRKPGYCSRPSV
jgi:phenylacetate-CoA ligase